MLKPLPIRIRNAASKPIRVEVRCLLSNEVVLREHDIHTTLSDEYNVELIEIIISEHGKGGESKG